MNSPIGYTTCFLAIFYFVRYILGRKFPTSWLVLGIIVISGVWYEHSLLRNLRLGYDFRCYFEAGRGNTDYVAHDGTLNVFFSYPNKSEYLWAWCRWFDLPTAFFIQYSLTVIAWMVICLKLVKYGDAGMILAVLVTYPMLLIQESGNVAGILSALALNPIGCLVSSLCKPLYLFFIPFHALILLYKRKRLDVLLHAEESTLAGGRLFAPQDDPDFETDFSLYEVVRKSGWK